VKASAAIPTPLGAASLTLFAWAITLFGTGLAASAGTTALAIGFCLGFGGVGTMAARSVPAPAEQRLGFRGFPLRFLIAILLIAPVIVLASEIDNWMPDLLPPLPPPPGGATPTDPELKQLETVEIVITMVLLRPVLEEFFFRGVIQQGLVAHLGAIGGVVQTAILSGVAAGGIYLVIAPNFAASAGVQAVFVGLVYGVLRHASGSLLAPILAAIVYGLLSFGVTALDLVPGMVPGGPPHTPVAILAPCAASVALGLWLAIRWRVSLPDPPVPPPVSE
jgi:membrane protease YdiL (CAAX protease family)